MRPLLGNTTDTSGDIAAAMKEERERVARRCIDIIKKYQHEPTIIERIREEFNC